MTQTKTDPIRNTIQHGDCIDVMRKIPARSVDFILTDPPYLVRYRDRSGRSIINDDNGDWLAPAAKEMFRVLKRDSLCISFHGRTQTDRFIGAWRAAGFRCDQLTTVLTRSTPLAMLALTGCAWLRAASQPTGV